MKKGLKCEETEFLMHDNLPFWKILHISWREKATQHDHFMSNLCLRRSKYFMVIRYCYKISYAADSTNKPTIINGSFKVFKQLFCS